MNAHKDCGGEVVEDKSLCYTTLDDEDIERFSHYGLRCLKCTREVYKDQVEHITLESKKAFYFTFGKKGVHRNMYVKIVAFNWGQARDLMIDAYDLRWAMQYTDENFKKVKAGLKKLETIDML
jgi:hypothetical protein